MTVGERIKEVREKTGMSQVDFADKINVSKQTLYKYENNLITNIPSDKIEAVAKVGGVSPAYLMGWDAQKERISAYYLALSKHEDKLITEYRKLNNMGKVKVLQTVQEMNCSPLYNDNYQEELKAAHARTDIDIPEGTDTSDDNIMDDENF